MSTTGSFEVTEEDTDWPACGEVRLKSVGGSIPRKFQGAFNFNWFNFIDIKKKRYTDKHLQEISQNGRYGHTDMSQVCNLEFLVAVQ